MELNALITVVGVFAIKVLAGIAILVIGFKLCGYLRGVILKMLEARQIDRAVAGFLASIISWTARIGVALAAVQTAGIEVTGFAALLAGAGVAIGMALSGNLQNFAGGILLLVIRPFKSGDVIKAQGFIGIVDEIQIFHTIVKTFENTRLVLPNGPLSNGPIENLSSEALRRCDFTFGIGYQDDIDKARDIIVGIVQNDERSLKDITGKEPFIAVTELGESSVNFTVRVWTKATDLWAFRFDTLERVKKAFDAQGVSIPFPQRDIHVYHETAAAGS